MCAVVYILWVWSLSRSSLSSDVIDHIWYISVTSRGDVNIFTETGGHMSKRGASDSLTGGTGDVNPQYWTLPSNTMSAANTFTEGTIPTPIPRVRVAGGKATVMEILKVFINLPEADANNGAGGSNIFAQAQLSTKSLSGMSFANPAVFAYAEKNMRGAFTAAGTYGTVTHDPQERDLTDGAGHGLLIATDNIYFGMNTSGFTAAGSSSIKILYRMKNVSVEEYIGIVQSQQ